MGIISNLLCYSLVFVLFILIRHDHAFGPNKLLYVCFYGNVSTMFSNFDGLCIKTCECPYVLLFLMIFEVILLVVFDLK